MSSRRAAATSRQQQASPATTAVAMGSGEIMPANSAGVNAGTNYLVALAGMKALESHVQDPSRGRKWKDRVASWEERAGLQLPSVKLALGFLDVLGVSRASVYKNLLENATRALLDKIPHLGEERMLLLLNDSFRYATQPELKSVPLKIITSMSTVPDKVLHKISELQTHQPAQFEELGLPLAIKRLAWEKDAKLFVKVVTPHAEKYIASEYAPKMILASQQVRVYRSLDTMKRRKLMGPQRINALAECTGGRPILIGHLCDEIANRFAREQSRAKAGLWATLLTDVLVTGRERAYGSIPDQSVDRLCALASRLDLAVREDVLGDSAVRDIQRLFREATGIGEDQHERAKASRRASAVDLTKVLKTAWAAVSKADSSMCFKEAVKEPMAPGYRKVVKTPMDLTTIHKKVKGGGYESFHDFDRDLKLMWENCRVYNGKNSKFYAEAQRQQAEWSKIAPGFEDTLRHHEKRQNQASTLASTGSTVPTSSSKRKSSGAGAAGTAGSVGAAASPDDSRSGTGGVGASLAPMATATQLERDGLGRRVGLAAMLLSEPFATKLMYRHASAGATEACRAREMLPRDHPTFAPLLQLLELGDAARAMFRAESFGVRAVEEALTRAVLPCVVALHTRVHHVLLAAAAEAAAAAAVSRGSAEALGADSSNKDVKEKAEKEAAAAVAAAADASEAADLALSLGIADGDGGCVHEDWRKWYKNFPAVRRVTCTMLCRALAVGVRGGAGTSGKGTGSGKAGERASQAAALLMPAARPAAKRMADERWLWATLAEVVQKNKALTGAGVGKNAAREAPSAGGLKPESVAEILELFSRGLDLAGISDAVVPCALEVVENLLPSPPPPAGGAAAGATATTDPASETKKAKKEKQNSIAAGGSVALGPYRALLEEIVDKAAAASKKSAAASADAKRVTGVSSEVSAAEEEQRRAKELFERIFAKAPLAWRNKLTPDGRGGSGAGSTGGGTGRGPSISIKGPKRKKPSSGGGGEGEGGGGSTKGGRGGDSTKKRARKK